MPRRHATTRSATQKEIGRRLRWARELVEPNRAQFARWMGVDRTTVQKIEDGDRAPSAFNLRDFALALRVTSDYLLFGKIQGLSDEMFKLLVAAHPELISSPPLAAPHSARSHADSAPQKPTKPTDNRAAA